MNRLIATALIASGLASGCVPATFLIAPAALKVDDKGLAGDKPELRYRPPVLATQVAPDNAKQKATELNDEMDRDLMDLVESQSKK